MEFTEIKEEEYREFFKWILEKEEVNLESKMDKLLFISYNSPCIYYTKEIEQFMQTAPMKRIGQITQLGTSINLSNATSHTRLEHCIGAYKNALDFWVLKCREYSYKESIEKSTDKDHKKNLILADILEMLRHDDCHTMLSHVLEGLICKGKVDHEDVGKRILLENEEYKETLNNIRPGLYETMCDNAINDKSAFKLLREGNMDFDRMDFVMRDLYYLGMPYSRGLIEKLLRNCNIKQIEIDGKTEEVPVYSHETLDDIESFLSIRYRGYKNEYGSKEREVLDSAAKYLCTEIAENEEIESGFIRDAIRNYMQDDVNDIDLDKFLQTNDIKFYTEVLDLAMNCKDENLRELATICLPSTIGLLKLGVEMLETRKRGKDLEQYKDYELEYIEKLTELRRGNESLQERLKFDNKKKLFSGINLSDESSQEILLRRIKDILGTEEIKSCGVVAWNRGINIYKESEPIYIEDEEGNIHTLDIHPDLTLDLSQKKLVGIAIIPSVMRLAGYSQEIVEQVTDIIEGHTLNDDNISNDMMKKYQKGKRDPEFR